MKISEILTMAGKIEETYIIASEPTKSEYGVAVRMTSDPYIQIVKTDFKDGKSNNFKSGTKTYSKHSSISIDVKYIPKFINAINKLMNMEM